MIAPEDLRRLAGLPATELWIGAVRQALTQAADLLEAAQAVIDERTGKSEGKT